MLKGRILWLIRRVAGRSELTFPLGAWGRLGNQLFQIAGTYAVATRQQRGVVFRNDWHYRPYFNLPQHWFAPRVTAARCGSAVPYVTQIPAGYRVYLQDLDLWEGRHSEIKELLAPSARALEEANAMRPDLADLPLKASVHIRRGDYLAPGGLHRQVPMNYYEQALATIADSHPVVFSDDPSWARRNFPTSDATFVDGNPDWADLTLMTQCDRHVCANSTFSWWGAFLSEDAQPIYPWVRGVLPDHLHRIYPDTWREIVVERT